MIPFPLNHKKAPMSKVTFSIQYAGLELQVIKGATGEEVVPLKPIADLFGLKWEEQRKKVTDSAYFVEFLGTCTPDIRGAGGQIRAQTCILLSRVAAYLMSINPDRVKAQGNEDGAKFLIAKQNEWADALHDYEELGAAVNLNHAKTQDALRRQRSAFFSAMGVLNKTSGAAERKAITSVIGQMATELGVPYQQELPHA